MITCRKWKKHEIEYLQVHCSDSNLKTAKVLNRSTAAVRRMKTTLGLTPKQADAPKIPQYNPNPITSTTKMCVCLWHSEGDSICEIAKMLQRPVEQIETILAECQDNGEYDLFVENKTHLHFVK